jgi:cytoskeletal protein RodZ
VTEKFKPSSIESIEAIKVNYVTDDDEEPISARSSVKAADKFVAGLDAVTNVLLTLVLKFGRATSMLVVVTGVLILCLVSLVIAVGQVFTIKSQLHELLEKHEDLSRAQARIEKSTQATQAVVETQPKITVDETGPKLVTKEGILDLTAKEEVPPSTDDDPKPKPQAKEAVVPEQPAVSKPTYQLKASPSPNTPRATY